MNANSCNLFCRFKRQLIGDLLLSGKFIDKESLEKALKEQKKTNKLLGELLVELGALSIDELNIVLKFQEELSNPKKAIKFAGGLRKRLGELLLDVAKITEAQLNEALSVQKSTGKKLGEILIEKGFIKERELKAALLFQKAQEEKYATEKIKLGELLVNLNIITPEQLDHALKIQEANPEKKLGEILIQLGYAKREEVEKGLLLQEKLATIALSTLLLFATNFFIDEVYAKEGLLESQKARVQITVEVKSFVRFNLIKDVKELIITRSNINSGYVELPDATLLAISTNTKSLFIIFEGYGNGIIEEVEVYGLGDPVKIGPNGGMVLIRDVPRSVQYNLSYKIKISKEAMEGAYVWPYAISVLPF